MIKEIDAQNKLIKNIKIMMANSIYNYVLDIY